MMAACTLCSCRGPAELIRAAARGCLDDVESFLEMDKTEHSCCVLKFALKKANVRGHHKCVTALIAGGADPNDTSTGECALMVALLTGQEKCVDVLLQHNVRLDIKDRSDTSVLMYAAQAGNLILSQRILDQTGTDSLMEIDLFHESIITYAAINGHTSYLRHIFPLMPFQSAFIKAAISDDVEEIRRLLEKGDNPNIQELNGVSALAICAMLDNHQCLELMLEGSGDLEMKDQTGRNYIHYAAACGSLRSFEILIQKGSQVSWTDNLRNSPLILAVRNGHIGCSALAIREVKKEHKILSESKINGQWNWSLTKSLGPDRVESYEESIYCGLGHIDVLNKTPLIYAAESGFIEIVRLLLREGACVDTPAGFNEKIPLMFAAGKGHTHVVQELLDRGSNVNIGDRTGCTALFYAAQDGHDDCMLLLLQAGAQIDTVTRTRDKSCALFKAIDSGQDKCAEIILKHMPKRTLNWSDSQGINGLLHAARTGNVHLLKVFLQEGLSLRSRDIHGNNALMHASASGYIKCMRFLVENMGMDVNVRNRWGVNALAIAARYNLPSQVIHYLIETGSDVNVHERGVETTPLMDACERKNVKSIQLLLAAGANARMLSKAGESALTFAVKRGNADPTIVQMLLEAEKTEGPVVFNQVHANVLRLALRVDGKEAIRVLLKQGYFDWGWFPFITSYDPSNLRLILKLLVTTCISPGGFEPTSYNDAVSPLLWAVDCNDQGAVKYILSNLYFTEDDYRMLLKRYFSVYVYGRQLEQSGDEMTQTLGKTMFSSPLPLTTLSFMAVSSAVGKHCSSPSVTASRQECVASLPLPNLFKKKLCFQEPYSQMCDQEWANMDLLPPIIGTGGIPKSLFLKITQNTLPLPLKCAGYACLCDKTVDHKDDIHHLSSLLLRDNSRGL